MDKSFVLKVEVRERTGTHSSVKVRKAKRLPAIVYGHKEEPLAISINEHDFTKAIHQGHRIMDLEIGEKREKVIVKDVQYDYLGKNVIHVDLVRVSMTEKLKVEVSVEFKGIAKGTQEGGIVEPHTDRLEVECLATNIPESLVVSVKEIGVGDSIHAGDIELPPGVTLVSDPSIMVLTCHLVAAAKSTEDVEEEMPSKPEVIGKDKEEEGESSEKEQSS